MVNVLTTHLTIKKNMYMETKSMIKMNSVVTDFFTCNDGVRQGEYLYPFFFLTVYK